MHTTGQAAVRLSILILAALVLLARDVGFDFVLGAFAAGLVVGLVLDTPDGEVVRMRLEGIGFVLHPDLLRHDRDRLRHRQPAHGERARARGAFLALLFVIRGSASLLWRRELGPQRTLSLAFFVATGLPLIVAIVDIGTDRGAIDADVGASLVGAGMISVLVYPFVATRLSEAGPARRVACRRPETSASTSEEAESRRARTDARLDNSRRPWLNMVSTAPPARYPTE